jgi:hypothetical protein
MRRRRFAIVCAVGALAIAGCADHGSYTLSWQFAGGEPPSSGCGKHGVDSIHVTGTSTGGDSETATALCATGELSHSIPVGTWTFAVSQIDVRGVPIDPADAQAQPSPAPASAVVDKDADVRAQPDPVDLTPRPTCRDGIDNNGDGRVDLDDPECNGDENANAEQ